MARWTRIGELVLALALSIGAVYVGGWTQDVEADVARGGSCASVAAADIVEVELAGDDDEMQRLVGGRCQAGFLTEMVRRDSLFILAYVAALGFLSLWGANRYRSAKMRLTGLVVFAVLLVAAGLDIGENIALGEVVAGEFGAAGRVAAFATAKWLLVLVVLGYGVAALVTMVVRAVEPLPPAKKPETGNGIDDVAVWGPDELRAAQDRLSSPAAADRDQRARHWWASRPPRHGSWEWPTPQANGDPLVGLSFSGGGIRSASFHLGCLQAIYERPAPPHLAKPPGGDGTLWESAHYLATVSGGGFLATGRQLADERGSQRAFGAGGGGVDDPQVQQLMDRGRYLWDGMGERARFLGRFVATIFLNLALVAALVLLATWPLGWAAVETGWLEPSGANFAIGGEAAWTVLVPTAVLVALAGVLGAMGTMSSMVGAVGRTAAAVVGTAAALGLTVATLMADDAWVRRIVLALAFVALVGIGLTRWCSVRRVKRRTMTAPVESPLPDKSPRWPAAADGGERPGFVKEVAKTLGGLVPAVLAVLLGCWWARAAASSDPGADWSPVAFGTAIIVAYLALAVVAALGIRAFVEGPATHRGWAVATVVFAVGAVVGAILWGGDLVAAAADAVALSLPVGWVVVGVSALVASVYFGVDQVWWSPHRAYRDRLLWAFGEPGDEDKMFSGLRNPKLGPTLLTCAAVHLPGRQYGRRDVGSFTFSRQLVGGPDVGWVRTEAYEVQLRGPQAEDASVAAAMAASGAAVASANGYMNLGALNASLALLNARLGVWLPNPTHVHEQRGRRPPPPGSSSAPPARRRFTYLLKEVFGVYDPMDRFVYVSDGGHHDNLGLIELLRRRCSVIVAFDASGDGPDRPTTFLEVRERAEEELGVTITPVDSNEYGELLNPNGTGQGRVAAFWIQYPALAPPPGHVGDPLPTSWGRLVLAKSREGTSQWAGGDEPRGRWPRDSTANQWFSAQRIENYRTLGRTVAEEALDRLEQVLLQEPLALDGADL